MSNAPFLDTNIFVYAFSDDGRTAKAQELLIRPYVTSVQALNEFAHVMRRKFRRDLSEVRKGITAIRKSSSRIVNLDAALNSAALDLLGKYNFGFYDALMIAAALEAQSPVFLSEDLQHGLVIDNKLTVTNPFL